MLKKYKLLNNCLDAISQGSINLLIEKGRSGMGKSFSTINYLKDNLINYKYISTYTTPLAFYKYLYGNRNKTIIVFDDLKSISDPLIKAMLKSACGELPNGKRIINYYSTSPILKKERLPEEFEIKARIILIFNEDLLGFESIINRGVLINFNFSFQEKLELFKELKLDAEIIKYIEQFCNEATRNLSIRSVKMLMKLKEDGFDFKIFAQEIFEQDSALADLITMDEKEWCDKTGHHRASFYRLRSKHKIKNESTKKTRTKIKDKKKN